MNIRNFYWLIIVVLSGALLFEWTSEKKLESIESHMMLAESMSQVGLGEDHVAVENEELFIVVSIESGSIIEARLKKHPVEKVVGSLGFRVFGSDSVFNYYFKSGFTGSNPSYELLDAGEGYVVLSLPLNLPPQCIFLIMWGLSPDSLLAYLAILQFLKLLFFWSFL